MIEIEKIERFHCGRCGYITDSVHIIKYIKKDGICPACNNGEGGKWKLKGGKLRGTK